MNNYFCKNIRFEIFIPVLASVLLPIIILLPIAIHPGWPLNHEYDASFRRLFSLITEWHLGRIIPTWSTELQSGYGSPMLGVYHKTFTYLSSAIWVICRNAKFAILISIGICMCTAFLGAHRCIQLCTRRSSLFASLTCGTLILISSYSTLDWLIRGAFAEFTAMALTCWVIAWCLKLINEGKWSISIGPLMALMIISHLIMAFYCASFLIIAFFVSTVKWKSKCKEWIKPATFSFATLCIMAIPFLIPIYAMEGMTRSYWVFNPMFSPEGTHQKFLNIFYDPNWRWGEKWSSLTIQMDIGIWVPAFIYFTYQLIFLLKSLFSKKIYQIKPYDIFFLISLSVYLMLQTKFLLPVFKISEILEAIQFTWRLQVFVTIFSAILAGLLIDKIHQKLKKQSYAKICISMICLVVISLSVQSSPLINPIKYDWMGKNTLATLDDHEYFAFNEYLPITDWRRLSRAGEINQLKLFMESTSKKCLTQASANTSKAWKDVEFKWQCNAAVRAAFPFYWAPGFAAYAESGDRKTVSEVKIGRTCNDPRATLLDSVPIGTRYIHVYSPSWWSTSMAALTTKRFTCE